MSNFDVTDRVITELTLFIDKWKAGKAKRAVKAPRGLHHIPDPNNRTLSMKWILEKWEEGSLYTDLSEGLILGLYAYATNSIDNLTDVEREIIEHLGSELTGLYDANYEHLLEKDFIEVLEEGFKEICQKYGNTAKCLEYMEFLFSNFKTRIVRSLGDSYKWILYCLVLNGTPYIAINKNYRPFVPGDAFYNLYVHYKRNPTYDYATYKLKEGNDTHTILFAIDGSSDTEISRLFWTGKRGNCVLLPTQQLINMLQQEHTGGEVPPPEYHFLMKLADSAGLVSYIDNSVGKWKDLSVPYGFLDLYKEVLGVQERLWRQAFEGRQMMLKTLDEITTMAKDEEKFLFAVSRSWESPNSRITYRNTCSNLNPDYERDEYDKYLRGGNKMYYIVASPNPGAYDVTILAFMFATEVSEKEVYIDLFCKSQHHKDTKAARYLFGYALKYFGNLYDYISLSALPMAIPFYEAYGFIRTPGDEDWVLPVQKGKRSVKRLYDPEEYRADKRQRMDNYDF